jgi:mRNA-degrading endonuclease RelE of RelBE toxin-antitoxin system
LAYRIEYSPDAENHLRALTARQRAIVLDTVDKQTEGGISSDEMRRRLGLTN